jgi:7-cyano-7-deazaguanine synthase
MKNAVIVLSGGLDSTTALAIAKSEGYACYALSFNYMQRNKAELNAAKKITESFGIKHFIFDLPLDKIGGSALTDMNIAVPDYVGGKEIPVTYVPARNTIFLSIALGYAEVLNADAIFLGISHVDYSGYPDCRPEYLQAFQQMANLATKAGVEGHQLQIIAPLIYLSKAETIKKGIALGVDYALTVSCYSADAEGRACGHCDSCAYRKKGFAEAGVADPTRYQDH